MLLILEMHHEGYRFVYVKKKKLNEFGHIAFVFASSSLEEKAETKFTIVFNKMSTKSKEQKGIYCQLYKLGNPWSI